jgi:glycosyltransferase involved in cell wall biosynthesis
METGQEEQIVVILSPQSWSHQFVSKHHYAVEFTKLYPTVFVSPTQCKMGRFSFNIREIKKGRKGLHEAQLTLPFPNWLRFKFNKFYCIINRIVLTLLIRKRLKKQIRLLIDFGCHRSIDRLDKFESLKSIYFPVDDYIDLPIKTRKADQLFTVSSNIQDKFQKAKLPMLWINHGLSTIFADRAKKKLIELENEGTTSKIPRTKIGYSGNITIPFLDRKIVLKTIKELSDMEFHFFGNDSSTEKEAIEFIDRLKEINNVSLHGQLSTEDLANQLEDMDILWLCYKADNKNYQLENSHKILEYLSTGKPILSSPIKYLKDTDEKFIYQFPNDKHSEMILRLKKGLEDYIKSKKRIEFALQSTYRNNISKLLKD